MPLESNEHENNTSYDAPQITADQGGDSGSGLPPITRPPDSSPYPPNENHSSDGGTQRRENAKLILEIFGAALLLTYTLFTCLQWLQIRYTNNLTARALDGSNSALTQTLIKLQGQIDQEGRQADNTKILADRMKDQAEQTKTIAAQAKVSAAAAKGAAEIAKEALHISEGALIIPTFPTRSDADKSLTIPIQNTGRILSGPVEITVHEMTIAVPDYFSPVYERDVAESHWKRFRFAFIAPSTPMTLLVLAPKMDIGSLDTGHQSIIVAGEISYRDGFPDTTEKYAPFCFQTSYQTVVKKSFFAQCDATQYLADIKKYEGYPLNEEK